MNQHNLNGQQPCWTCKKAIGGCSWSRTFTPIPGWDAEPTLKGGCNTKVASYKINYCPEYEREQSRKPAWVPEQIKRLESV